ncbi:hypothetical protein SKAU_G00296880 [Synaphobranchus kaupii]|uniref:Protein Wnt n=1 Tax=Synaphobranchus kaupii TaxID=118154 RepID=A0A9Q1EUX0_SYNKA|nr:hypothetical protein SKAU_G00296880 [Synaphobranchus kaupii]
MVLRILPQITTEDAKSITKVLRRPRQKELVDLGSLSLALGQQYSSLGSQPILCGSIPGLVPKQLRFCRNYIEIMPSVAEGVKLGIQECQHQFRGRRWNCTTIEDNLAIFGPVLDKATRESAFVHAIASAGVAFAVTRSCAEGTSTMCGCDSHHKGPPGEGWKWGGCSEDAEFGVLVSREFADARENRPDARSAMNRHNNEAGRTTILDHMHLRCKCHGLSGSCEVKTCWWAQPDFRTLGDFLKDKYDSASEMVVEKHRESRGWVETLRAKYAFFKHPTERDLVYYEGSPNFCEPNAETGSFGHAGPRLQRVVARHRGLRPAVLRPGATTRGLRSARRSATASSTGAATSAAGPDGASTQNSFDDSVTVGNGAGALPCSCLLARGRINVAGPLRNAQTE